MNLDGSPEQHASRLRGTGHENVEISSRKVRAEFVAWRRTDGANPKNHPITSRSDGGRRSCVASNAERRFVHGCRTTGRDGRCVPFCRRSVTRHESSCYHLDYMAARAVLVLFILLIVWSVAALGTLRGSSPSASEHAASTPTSSGQRGLSPQMFPNYYPSSAASDCVALIERIQYILTRAKLTAEGTARIEELVREGSRLHRAGQHAKCLAPLKEALRVLLGPEK